MGSVCQPGSVVRVHVLNLSTHGALCHAPEQPEAGSAVMLGLADLRLFARVVWIKGTRFGLRFDRPIDAGVVRLAIHGADAAGEGAPPR